MVVMIDYFDDIRMSHLRETLNIFEDLGFRGEFEYAELFGLFVAEKLASSQFAVIEDYWVFLAILQELIFIHYFVISVLRVVYIWMFGRFSKS